MHPSTARSIVSSYTLNRQFWTAFADGLACFALVGNDSFYPRRYQSSGRLGDMQNIGNDIRIAFDSFGDSLGSHTVAGR